MHSEKPNFKIHIKNSNMDKSSVKKLVNDVIRQGSEFGYIRSKNYQLKYISVKKHDANTFEVLATQVGYGASGYKMIVSPKSIENACKEFIRNFNKLKNDSAKAYCM